MQQGIFCERYAGATGFQSCRDGIVVSHMSWACTCQPSSVFLLKLCASIALGTSQSYGHVTKLFLRSLVPRLNWNQTLRSGRLQCSRSPPAQVNMFGAICVNMPAVLVIAAGMGGNNLVGIGLDWISTRSSFFNREILQGPALG